LLELPFLDEELLLLPDVILVIAAAIPLADGIP
jgi:hypothetical protein